MGNPEEHYPGGRPRRGRGQLTGPVPEVGQSLPTRHPPSRRARPGWADSDLQGRQRFGRERSGRILASGRDTRLAYEQGKAGPDEIGDGSH